MSSHIDEMDEKALFKVASWLSPNLSWKAQERFYYDPSNKKRFYQVDCASVDGKVILEYEGPNHYCDVWKDIRDGERRRFFTELGYSFKRWPYYCQLTHEVAHYFFGEFNEMAYLKCLNEIYRANSEREILACGFHYTFHTPSQFTYRGVDRFIEELEALPLVVKSQVAETLRRYCRDMNDPELVLGRDKRLHQLLSFKRPLHELVALYLRQE